LVVLFVLLLTDTCAIAKHYARPIVEHLETAERLIGAADYEKAKQVIAFVLKQDPMCTDALNNLCVIYLRQHQFDKAKDFFERSLKIDPLLPTSLNNLGQVYYFSGNYDAAVDAYKRALLLMHGRDCLLSSNLGDALTAKGDYKDAGDCYQEVLKTNASFPQALLGLANLYFHIESYALAYQYAVRAIKSKPGWALAYYQLGRVEQKRGHRLEALRAYALSLRYERNPAYANDTRKLIAELGGDNPANLSNLAKAPSFTPNSKADQQISEKWPHSLNFDRQISLEHAQLCLASQKWLPAQRELENLLKQAADPVVYNDLGLVYAGQKNFAQAQNFYLKAIRTSKGKCSSAYYNLGQLYRLKGDFVLARDNFSQAINSAKRQGKSCPLARNALALVLKESGDEAGALAAYKLALSEADSDFPVLHYNYAILLEETDHAREAVKEYKRYLELAPQGLNVDQAMARLRRLGVDS